MTPEKIKETLRNDPLPWDDLRERRVLGDIQQQLSNDPSLQRIPLSRSPLKHIIPQKIALAAAAILLLCLGGFVGARLFAPLPSSSHSDNGRMTAKKSHEGGRESTLEITGLGKALLSSRARMIWEKETDDEIHLSQPIGRIHYVISPQRRKTLVIHAKQVEVRVIGTVFNVEVNRNAVSVSVQKGLVSVVAGDRKLFLGAGERFETQLDAINQKQMAKPQAPETQSDASGTAAHEDNHNVTPSTHRRAAEEISPNVNGNLDTRIPAGISRPENGAGAKAGDGSRIDDILKAVDTARKQGDYPKAKQLLNQAIHAYPTDPRMPICYFTLGNVSVSSGQYNAAAGAYRKYLLLAPGGILAEDASAAIADALNRAGDRKGASNAAEAYLEKYATGIHAQRMKALTK